MYLKREKLTTGQVLGELQICQDTLRNWERRGVLVPTREPHTKWRLYSQEDVERVKGRISSKRLPGISVLVMEA